MTDSHAIRSDRCAWITTQLQAAWPRLHRVSIKATLDERGPHTESDLFVELSCTGEESDLLAYGLATPADLAAIPACGHYSRIGYSLTRGRRGTRVTCYTHDLADDRREQVQRVWDAMARVLAPAVWMPPRAEAP